MCDRVAHKQDCQIVTNYCHDRHLSMASFMPLIWIKIHMPTYAKFLFLMLIFVRTRHFHSHSTNFESKCIQ